MHGLFALDARAGAAVGIAIGLLLFGGLLAMASLGELRGRRLAKVPPAYRPAPSDEELESRTLVKYLIVGTAAVILMSLWLPLYWFREPVREASKRTQFQKNAVDAGKTLFEGNPNAEPPVVGFCIRCHGIGGEGTVQQYLINGATRPYAEPPLKYVYSRYEQMGRSDDEITQLIFDAIQRGRPGTPMPTWSIAFGGSFNSAQIDDLIAYIQSIQVKFPAAESLDGAQLFLANCAVCHNSAKEVQQMSANPALIASLAGRGSVGPNLQIEFRRLQEDHGCDTPGATTASMGNLQCQVYDTIRNGRLNTNRPSMPAWAGLGDKAIHSLVLFLRSIQR
ncbi:MAG: cytochrome c [Actinomycetota bacterium]